MRVALVFPPLRVSRDFIDYPYFADLGAVQAAGRLRALGHEVALVDALARPGAGLAPLDDGYVRLGVPVAETLAALGEADVAVVAYTPFHRPPERDPLLGELLAGLRAAEPELPIVLADLYQSGQHVVDAPSAEICAAYPEIDVLVRYEAEDELPALVERLAQGRPGSREVVVGRETAQLDALPLPAWDLVDLDAYWSFHESVVVGLGRSNWAFPIVERSLPLLTSRGCPFRCAHCSSNPGLPEGAPKKQRRYSPEYLARHLDLLVELGARRVHLLDELANVNERHFDRLLELLAERGLSFEIPNGVRADYVLEKHLAAMRGKMTTLSISAESGVQRVVDEVVGKELDLGAIVATAERAEAAGVPLLVHFIIGMPGETKDELDGTLAFALDLHDRFGAWPSVQFATPLPGTRLARAASQSGHVLPVVHDWGPHFQKAPSISTPEFTLDELRELKQTFDLGLSASQGPQKVSISVARMHTATVFTNLTCNQHCSFCTFRRERDDAGFANKARIRSEIREAAAQGARTLVITGGEPTLDPELAGHIRTARDAGFNEIILETNAMILAYPRRAEALAAAGLSTVRVALNAATADSDAITEVVGGFELTLRGADNAVQAGLALEISTALFAGNLHTARTLPGFVANRLPDVRRIVLRAVSDAGEGLVAHYLPLSGTVVEMAKAAREAGLDLGFDPRHAIPLCLFPERRRYPELFSMGPPHAGHGFDRVQACDTCVARESCPGIQHRYLELHGSSGIDPLGQREARFVRGLGGERQALVEKDLTADSICYTEEAHQLERVVRINFHCNQDCPFCFVNRDLPAEAPERIHKEIDRAASDGARLLSLSGGEPTLNPHLADYIRRGTGLGMLVQLQTNAIRCAKPGYAATLAEAGLARAFVSLHGASAVVSDRITQAPGTFERTIAGITELLGAGMEVWLNCVITGENFRELPALVEMVHRHWGTAPRLNLSYANASTDLVPVTPEVTPRFADVRPFVAQAFERARRLGISVNGLDGECGLPLCFLEPAWLDVEILAELPAPNPAPGFEKPTACNDCALFDRCVGVRSHYAELHGVDEVTPIPRRDAGGSDARARQPSAD